MCVFFFLVILLFQPVFFYLFSLQFHQSLFFVFSRLFPVSSHLFAEFSSWNTCAVGIYVEFVFNFTPMLAYNNDW